MSDWTPPEPALAALRGLCPRCGARGLFAGAVSFAPACRQCDLDFARFNVGDGPAAFLLMIIGAIVMIAMVIAELRYAPPIWVHALLWIPLTLVLTVVLLRLAKGLLVALEYRNRAREGRLAE